MSVTRLLAGLTIAVLLAGCAMIGAKGGDDQPDAQALENQAGALDATPDAASADQRLRQALDTIYSDSTTTVGLTYYAEFIDLDGDGQKEAVAYVLGPNHCDPGCDLYVLKPQGKRYEAVSRTPVVQAPLYALDHRSHGWRDLLVTTIGGKHGSARQLMRYEAGSYVPVENDPADDAQRTPLIESFDGPGHALHPSRSDAEQATP